MAKRHSFLWLTSIPGLPWWFSVIHLPMQEMFVRPLGREDPLEEMPTHSSILAWEI